MKASGLGRRGECSAQRPLRLATKVVEEVTEKILAEVAEGRGGGVGGDREASVET